MARPLSLVVAPAAELTQERLRLAVAARAPNTVLGYATDWKYFALWCEERGIAALPASDETVALYLTDKLNRGYRVTLRPMNPCNVTAILKRAVAAIGLDPRRFGAHSLRAGFVSEAIERGAREFTVARQTGHRSLTTLRRYYRPEDPFSGNPCAALGL